MKLTKQNRDIVLTPNQLHLAKDKEETLIRLITKHPDKFGKHGSQRTMIEVLAREEGIEGDDKYDQAFRRAELESQREEDLKNILN